MLKKLLINQKGKHILKNYSIILLYHYNNVSTKNWHSIKNELKKMEDVNSLVIQNKITLSILENLESTLPKNRTLNKGNNDKSLFTVINDEEGIKKKCKKEKREVLFTLKEIKNIFQGPTFLLACNSLEHLPVINHLMGNFSNFIFVGGLYNNQILSHHTLEKLIELNESVKYDFVRVLYSQIIVLLTLKHHLIKNFFTSSFYSKTK